MWLRLVLKLFIVFCIFSACSSPDRQVVNKLNSLSYAYHYRNLDSTEYYARRALDASSDYPDGMSEALNNLAFVSISRMDYEKAHRQLDSIILITDNQLELLIANIQQMRLCQRRSNNREFYDYREHALKAINRINEERSTLSDNQKKRLLYAESELCIVTSTYYYYIGLEQQSIEEIQKIGVELEGDTAQWLNYLYNVGAGGVITDGDVDLQEFDYLFRCLLISKKNRYNYFYANSLEGIAEKLADLHVLMHLMDTSNSTLDYLNENGDSLYDLSIILAHKALDQFIEYGDIYQIAGAYRTLATCYRARGNYEQALTNLELALSDSSIYQAPDLVASIREQLSVAYAAIDDKPNSDYNRNIYLDLQEQTRQDRSLEARADQLNKTIAQLNILLVSVLFALILLVIAFRVLYVFYRRTQLKKDELDEMSEQREDLLEKLAIARQKHLEGERRNLDQRAKISLVYSITPLIDRMLHEVKRISGDDTEQLQYIKELTDTINEQNNILTQWIQLKQGELSLHIESFNLQETFDIIDKGRRSFSLKGITLHVADTDAIVKADKVLTLFMLNTLADNARKFTPQGGEVRVNAEEANNYIEISVTDTGQGMDENELAHVFDHKVTGGHGFGLLNCRGIIEKYRKTSKLFSVCILSAESSKGHGSRFFFRLPKGVVRLTLLLLLNTFTIANAQDYPSETFSEDIFLQRAAIYADSSFNCNVNGEYERTLLYSDSCFKAMNAYYRSIYKGATDTLQLLGSMTLPITEVRWLHNDIQVNYNTLLIMRNESAVAALALHHWALYQYNNRIYTLLFKELSADQTLDNYCRRMQQSQTDRMIAVVLLVIIALTLLAAIVFQYIQAMGRKAAHKKEQEDEIDLLHDELRRIELENARLHVSNLVLDNCLSTLKHETMYYPSRIRQLVEIGDFHSIYEVVEYYRALYGILSEQADTQIRNFHLHLKHLDNEVLGDENLLCYLFDILRRQSPQKQINVKYETKDNFYVECRVELIGVKSVSFMPTVENIPYFICRQIVREHGEATGCRACGITAEAMNNGTRIIIILPKQICKNSK